MDAEATSPPIIAIEPPTLAAHLPGDSLPSGVPATATSTNTATAAVSGTVLGGTVPDGIMPPAAVNVLPPSAATIAVTGDSFENHGGLGRGRGRGRGRGGGGRGGRQAGAKNYRNGILIDIIDELRPFGNNMWELVAQRYKELSEEDVLRDVKDLKDHWVKKLCNNFKKPTGRTGDAGDRINRCIVIEREIQAQTEAGVLGASSGEDGANDDADSSGVDDLYFSGRDNEDEDDGFDVLGRTTSGTAGGGLTTAESDLTGSGSTQQKSSDTRRSRSRSATPVITRISGGKTKNSSNRDRASVTRSIQDLTTLMSERMRGNNDNDANITTTMQMMQQSQMQMQMQLVEMQKQG